MSKSFLLLTGQVITQSNNIKVYSFSMNQLAAIVYDKEDTAGQVFDKLKDLQEQYLIELEDIAYVVKDENGKLHVHQGGSLAGAGAAGGAFWGLLIGMLFFAPFAGMAIGAISGGAAGAMSDYGIDDNFIRELATNSKNGSSTLFVLFRNANPDKVIPEIATYGGKVIKTSLTKDAEDKLQQALSSGAATL